MANRTSAFTVTVSPHPTWDGVWGADILDGDGLQGKQSGNKMCIVGSSLEMVGKGLDRYIAERKERQWKERPRRKRRRRK